MGKFYWDWNFVYKNSIPVRILCFSFHTTNPLTIWSGKNGKQ